MTHNFEPERLSGLVLVIFMLSCKKTPHVKRAYSTIYVPISWDVMTRYSGACIVGDVVNDSCNVVITANAMFGWFKYSSRSDIVSRFFGEIFPGYFILDSQ